MIDFKKLVFALFISAFSSNEKLMAMEHNRENFFELIEVNNKKINELELQESSILLYMQEHNIQEDTNLKRISKEIQELKEYNKKLNTQINELLDKESVSKSESGSKSGSESGLTYIKIPKGTLNIQACMVKTSSIKDGKIENPVLKGKHNPNIPLKKIYWLAGRVVEKYSKQIELAENETKLKKLNTLISRIEEVKHQTKDEEAILIDLKLIKNILEFPSNCSNAGVGKPLSNGSSYLLPQPLWLKVGQHDKEYNDIWDFNRKLTTLKINFNDSQGGICDPMDYDIARKIEEGDYNPLMQDIEKENFGDVLLTLMTEDIGFATGALMHSLINNSKKFKGIKPFKAFEPKSKDQLEKNVFKLGLYLRLWINICIENLNKERVNDQVSSQKLLEAEKSEITLLKTANRVNKEKTLIAILENLKKTPKDFNTYLSNNFSKESLVEFYFSPAYNFITAEYLKRKYSHFCKDETTWREEENMVINLQTIREVVTKNMPKSN